MLETTQQFALKRLENFIRANCFEILPPDRLITLSSGAQSNVYFDLKRALMDPNTLNKIAMLMDHAMLQHPPTDFIAGPELGGVPLAVAVGQYTLENCQIPRRPFLVRKEAKDHGNTKLIQGLRKGETLQGRTVTLLEDVTTTGGSSLRTVEPIRAAGGIVSRIISVLDRQEGATARFAQEGIEHTTIFIKSQFITPEQEIFHPAPPNQSR